MRPAWMDRPHEFREDVGDCSMCVCGIPALVHEAWEAGGLCRDVLCRNPAHYELRA